jgi:LuxR family maltose regulon positive regulatory protein
MVACRRTVALGFTIAGRPGPRAAARRPGRRPPRDARHPIPATSVDTALTALAPPTTSRFAEDLLLKVTPPRVPRHLLARPRLMADDEALRDRPVILVQAPAGFGKTSLLAQWRLEHLAHGAVVAWVSAQARDDVQRLVQAFALAVRVAAGRPTFGHTLLDVEPPPGLEGVTSWLAELAHAALNVVLVVDTAEHLPPDSLEALAYVLRNAPPNLRAVVAARSETRLDIGDLVDYGHALVVGPAMLCFRLEETIELARARLGARVDPDTAARLHDVTEGWPLGLQLALTVLASAKDPRAEVAAMAAHAGSVHDHLVGLLLANLAPADVDFLVRISVLDNLQPALCQAVTGARDAAARLEAMGRDTPVFVAAEHGHWLRIHTLARDVLRDRFAALPEKERRMLHTRAAGWHMEHGQLEAAGRHALASGQETLAYELAERSLYESMVTGGRQGDVLAWLAHLPEAEFDRRPRLLLAAAWSLATSDRHDEAGRLVERILQAPEVDDSLRCECALIRGGAAIFADEPDRFAALHDPWAEAPPLHDALMLRVHANRTAIRALLEGEPALARLRQQQAPAGHFDGKLAYVNRWGEFIAGLSYLWEGQALLAENLMQPTLAGAETELGRRSAFTCMLAAVLAAAVWERNRPAEAAALLANRLDVLERHGLPETVLIAYRTLARIAVAQDEDHRALELLGALHAVGVARRLPRLRVASLLDQVRLHAHRYHADTCRGLCVQIDALLADPELPQGRLWRRSVEVLRALAHGHAAFAAREWRQALGPLGQAEELARELQQTRLVLEIQGLRAYALDRCGERSLDMMREATDVARSYGLQRVFADAHPDLDAWMRQALQAGDAAAAAGAPSGPPAARPMPPREAPAPRASASTALTPKEREVVALLARNLSNKEIGLAMQVGEETVKWHVKNLFAKLDAGTRKQVVQRAHILGLLEAGS